MAKTNPEKRRERLERFAQRQRNGWKRQPRWSRPSVKELPQPMPDDDLIVQAVREVVDRLFATH